MIKNNTIDMIHKWTLLVDDEDITIACKVTRILLQVMVLSIYFYTNVYMLDSIYKVTIALLIKKART
ncbi:Uncharacterised protein [Streptococcus pneumoniae]|nr:Uncharacterised protein [Streptococcus pneumoniae]